MYVLIWKKKKVDQSKNLHSPDIWIFLCRAHQVARKDPPHDGQVKLGQNIPRIDSQSFALGLDGRLDKEQSFRDRYLLKIWIECKLLKKMYTVYEIL